MRIEQVTEYVAADGRRFKTEAACKNYESELERVKPIMDRLPNNDVKGGEYIQHDPGMLNGVKADLWRLVLEKYGDNFPRWREWNSTEVHPMSIVGRVLSDGDMGPLERAWCSLNRFNFDLGREYDQAYFALHPEKAVEAGKELV